MNRKGFTLLEVLVVIVLIAVVTAIVCPCLLKASRKAKAINAIFPLKAGEIAHMAPLLDDEVIVVYRYESTIESLREYNELVDQGTAVPLVACVTSQLTIVGYPSDTSLRAQREDGKCILLMLGHPTKIHLPCTFEGHEFTKEIDVKMNPPVEYVDPSGVLATSNGSTRTDPDDS